MLIKSTACKQSGAQLRQAQIGTCLYINTPLSYWNTYVDMFHDFVDEAECQKIRWALVYDKPERLLDTLHATNSDLYSAIYSIICILQTMPVSSTTSEKSFSAMRGVKSYLRSTIGDERLSNLSLIVIMQKNRYVQVELGMIIYDFASGRNQSLHFS